MAFQWTSTFGHHETIGEFDFFDSSGEWTQTDGFQLLHEGYLTVSTSAGEPYSECGPRRNSGEDELEANGHSVGNAAAQSLRKSNEGYIKGWKRYWCVLSQNQEKESSLLYYTKQSVFTNCEAPVGAIGLNNWKKLYTLPQHSKSEHMFALDLPYKTVMLFTENDNDLEDWLGAFRKALGVVEAKEQTSPGIPAGLKGLPKQKMLRQTFFSVPPPGSKSPRGSPAPAGPQLVPGAHSHGRKNRGSSSSEIPSLEDEDDLEQAKAAAKNVRILTYKVFPATS